MSDENLPVPNEGEEEANKKLTLRKDATTEVTPADAEETSNAPAIVDPTRRRDTDTANLKRLRADSTGAPEADPDNTDTVNIKVIKEQKKQFKNMMTSSQTLRVRPSDGGETQAPAADTSKRTLKIKAPGVETKTESIARPTLKVSTETQAPAVTDHSPRSTLKIKAPAGAGGTADQGTGKSGGTLKIKAPGPGQTQPGAEAPGDTVKQTSSGAQKKTLKLRQAPEPQEGAQQAPQRQAAPVAPAAAQSTGADIFYMVASLITSGLLGYVLYQNVEIIKILGLP
ncbi:MAG: hypothetical protein HRT89_11340 [Lentisphaeria bacterium]|nr:hypothetical protein [Lentisphaeria bacterium]NQZ68649.1 hypothetical protein [Lentisphaeria bacterium]